MNKLTIGLQEDQHTSVLANALVGAVIELDINKKY